MNVFLETERLIIRPISQEDLPGMYAMNADPEVHKYLSNHPVQSIEAERQMITSILKQYEDYGIGRWTVIEKNTNDFVGWTGFKFMPGPINKHSNFIDFGYRLMRKHWNKGYASESGKASLEYGIKTFGYKDVYAMTDIDNAASRRVLEKLGFHLYEIFPYDAEPNWRAVGAPTTWYKLALNI
jgi:[ribosomal protein S5]-alanine N-acetyltransferase